MLSYTWLFEMPPWSSLLERLRTLVSIGKGRSRAHWATLKLLSCSSANRGRLFDFFWGRRWCWSSIAVSWVACSADNQLCLVFGAAVNDTVSDFADLVRHLWFLWFLLLLRLLKETLAADWHVGFFAADQLNAWFFASSQRECSLRVAKFADRVQVLDLLRFRNQVKDGVEAFSLVSSAERTHNDDFASMGGILAEFDDLKTKNEW